VRGKVGVRVRIRVVLKNGKSLGTVALVNTGFEAPVAQLLLPVKAAEQLGLWPNLPDEAVVEIYDTAGGPTRVYKIPSGAGVSILTEEGESRRVLSDIVISHIEVEALISDKLAEELVLTIEKPGEGLWRFRGEEKERRSEKPEYWM
jgi:hypothetical protein